MKLKLFVAPIAIALAFTIANSQAAQIRMECLGTRTYGVFLDGEELNGQFDTLIVDIRPDRGFSFSNLDPNGVDNRMARPGGDPFTFINAFLGAPIGFGGNGFTLLGPTTTEHAIQFAAGPLFGMIDTANGPNVGPDGLFLANLFEPGPGLSAEIQLVSGGNILANLSSARFLDALPCVPEPTSLTLFLAGVLALASSKRIR